jgi:hypothetical protein
MLYLSYFPAICTYDLQYDIISNPEIFSAFLSFISVLVQLQQNSLLKKRYLLSESRLAMKFELDCGLELTRAKEVSWLFTTSPSSALSLLKEKNSFSN